MQLVALYHTAVPRKKVPGKKVLRKKVPGRAFPTVWHMWERWVSVENLLVCVGSLGESNR